ncbi:polymorphic toxin-type HINT domain-containing protein [Streptomyces sp. CA-100214]
MRRLLTPLVGLLSVVLSLTLLEAPSWAAPVEGFSPRSVPKTASVSGTDLVTHHTAVRSQSDVNLWRPPEKPVWPAGGEADVSLPEAPASTLAKKGADRVQAGSLPVRIGRPSRGSGSKDASRSAAPTGGNRLHVTVADRQTTQRAGIDGLLLSLEPADVSAMDGAAEVQVDYTGIASAYGADWASRLRLVRLPACALTTPKAAKCRQGVPLVTDNDTKARTLTATVTLPAPDRASSSSSSSASQTSAQSTVVLAAVAGASGDEGSFKATSLSPSGSWSAGGNSGGFGWSIPFGVPPAPGGLEPKVALSYNSSAVDGRTSSTNNQTSWVGEGWEYSPGYIERTYAACENDREGGNNTEEVGDLCWKSQNATLSLNGRSTPLVWDAGKSVWKPADDDGSRVELIKGSAPNDVNDDADHEYWKITTVDGTQYWFGKNRLPGWSSGKDETNSVFTVPVYGNHSGEPGHGTDFASSAQTQGWRWNLDYVVDPHNDAMALYYTKEAGYYAQNSKIDDPVSYIRGGYLTRIDYGLRAGQALTTANPAGQVKFGVSDRCTSNCILDEDHATNWPDVPVDLNCTADEQCLQATPSFWSTKRLTSVNTFALQGSTMQPVDTWTLTSNYPGTGDISKPSLWLASVQHTAKAGALADVTLPKITTGGSLMPNRVDAAEGRAPLNRYRLTRVTGETGANTLVTYSPTECTTTNPPDPDENSKRCYPSWWTPDGAVDPVKDWFHKYVVTQVIEDDTTAGTGSESKTTTYEYADGPHWRRDTGEFTLDKHRTWSDFRGYGTVRTLTGTTNRTKTESTYFLGMAGDTLADGSTRNAPKVNGITDRNDFSGRTAETRTYDKDGTGGKIVAKTTFLPWASDGTATQHITGITDPDKPGTAGPTLPDTVAHLAGTATEKASVLLDDGNWRTLTTARVFDPVYGLLTSQGDDGDPERGVQPVCTRTTYVTPDKSNWLIAYPSQVVNAVSPLCEGGILNTAITSASRTSYDGGAPGSAPKPGQVNATRTEAASKLDGNGALVWETTNQAAHDQYGRTTSSTGQDGQTTTTTYTPATGAQPTTLTVTNPKNQTATTTFDGLRGLTRKATDANGRTATSEYDSMGRLTKAWGAGRATTEDPNATFTYSVSATAPSAVTTKTRREDGTWSTSVTLYDSLLRERQTQSDAVGVSGRTVTDTFYDTHGRAFQTNAPFYNDQPVSTTLLTVTPNKIPASSVTQYDGRGRPTATLTLSLNVEKWRTTTTYGDTWTATLPPAGGTAELAVNDMRGRTIERREYKDRTPIIGASADHYEATRYAYDAAGNLSKVTDGSGRNTWTYTYDLRGRQTASSDPDKGAGTTVYGKDGRIATTTDARKNTLATTYDELGRKTSLRIGSSTGTKLAEWTYDTAPGGKGLAANSIRYDTSVTPAAAYTTSVTGYDTAGNPTGTKVTVPSVPGEEELAGTYTVAATATPVNNLPATTAYSTSNTNATTALPAETVTNHYVQDQLSIVDGTLSQAYLRGATYTPFGELAQAQLGNLGTVVTQTLGYDTITRRLATSITDRQAAGPKTLSNIKYSYDTVGNLTRIRDDQNDGTVIDDQCFAYDWARRLSEAWTSGDACTTQPATGTPSLGTTDPYWTSWTFTNSGDRATETQHAAGPVIADTTHTYSYPTTTGAAQPHAARTVTATGGDTGTDAYQYDTAGNLTKKTPATGAAQGLTWNEEGKLATSTVSSATTSFLYDADGTRILKRQPAETTLYLPGGQELVLNKSTGALAGTRYYTVPGGSAVRTSSDGRVRILVADHHGTNTLSISATTLAFNRRKNLPYGAPRGTTPTFWPGQKGFINGDIDPTTGLTHIGARDYDPTTGRFISVDPLLELDKPQTIGGYAYSAHNPTTYSDPTGTRLGGCEGGWQQCGPGGNGGDTDNGPLVVEDTGTGGSGSDDGTGSGTGSGGNSGGGQECSWYSPCGWSDTWDDAKEWVSENKAVIGGVVAEVVVGGLCFSAAGGASVATGGVSLAASAGCGALASAAGASVNNALTPDADHSATGQLKEQFDAAAWGAAGGVVGYGIGSKISPCHSFLPGTGVLMADGTHKAIEDIQVGDTIVTTDVKSGKTTEKNVVDTITTEDDKNFTELTVATDDEPSVIVATDTHPFWVVDRHEWIDAGKIHPGQMLRTSAGTHVQVTAVSHYTKRQRTHDLTIEDIHAYYVLAGATPVLVHNCNVRLTQAEADTLQVGPYADGSVPATGPVVTPAQSAAMQGRACHTCGGATPTMIGDHQPSTGIGPASLPRNLFPHCGSCSDLQSVAVQKAQRMLREHGYHDPSFAGLPGYPSAREKLAELLPRHTQ